MEPAHPNYNDLSHRSYIRVLTTGDFFGDFYDAYLSSSEEVAEKLGGTDVVAQAEMLAQSLTHMVAYSANGVPSPTLRRIAKVHGKAQRNIKARLYDHWLEALLATARRHDVRWDRDVEAAWRRVLAPGIAYMKSCYDPPPRPPLGSLRSHPRPTASARRKVLTVSLLLLAWLLVLILAA